MIAIVDTNVILVANSQHQNVSPECIKNCAANLRQIMFSGKAIIDDRFRILREYQNKTSPKRGNGPGDVFVKWLLNNLANSTKCEQVSLNEISEGHFVEFPNHEKLDNFDLPDRKFVAVSAAHPEHPPILQAADSKWLDWSDTLSQFGIRVSFLCQNDIERFHLKKFGV